MVDINSLHAQARALISSGRYDKARETLVAAKELEPDHPDILLMLGSLEMQSNDLHAASVLLEQGIRVNPQHAACQVQLGLCYKLLGRSLDAIRQLETAISTQPDIPRARILLSDLLRSKFDVDGSIEQLEQELQYRPQNVDALADLALMYDQANRSDEAYEMAEKVLKWHPEHLVAMQVLANSEKNRGHFTESEVLYSKIAVRTGNANQKAITLCQLGHVLDRQHRYDDAFEAYKNSNATWKQLAIEQRINPETYRRDVNSILEWVKSGHVPASSSVVGLNDRIQSPIFLVGFPRSGTTLMEKVLEQHPDISGSREKILLDMLASNIARILGNSARYPACLASLTEDQTRALRNAYWQLATTHIEGLSNDDILLDKLPLNMVHLPLVSAIFPDSKILVALRDPRDVCLSCYQQSFSLNAAMANFVDLKDTAKLYTEVMELWLLMREKLSLNWIEYRYEDLVDDFDSVTRRIFNFLELKYPEQAANYHEDTNRALLTPSYQDASKPVYKRSKARWMNYEKHLAPIVPQLQPYIESFGYPIE